MHTFDNNLPASGYFSVKPHWFVIACPSIFGVIFGLLFLNLYFISRETSISVLFIIFSFLSFIWPLKRIYFMATCSYTITKEYVTIKRGFFNNKIVIPVNKIENFSLKQPPMGAIFNFAHTTLSTDTKYGDVRISWVPNCRNFIAKIYNLTGNERQNTDSSSPLLTKRVC